MSATITTIGWRTPIRSVGSRLLQDIPNEIFYNIFDYFNKHDMNTVICQRSLANLSLVCHAFYVMAHGRLFEHCVLSGSSRHDSTCTFDLCAGILTGTHLAVPLAVHVKECTVMNWPLPLHSQQRNGALRLYGKTLRHMPNLRRLVINHTTIDEEFLEDLCQVTGLRELVILFSTFSPSVTPESIATVCPLRLSSLEIETCKGARNASILAHFIDPSCVEWCKCSSWDIFAAIFEQLESECSLVEVLLFEAKDDAVLRKILRLSPAMKILKFTYMMSNAHPTAPLPSTAMPNLHTVDCTAGMLPELIPNRPVHSIGIPVVTYTTGALSILGPNRELALQTPPMGLADVELFKSSAVDIYRLHVPSHFFFAVSFSTHFPHLKALELDFTHPNYVSCELFRCPQSKADFEATIEDICRAIDPMPSVNKINLSFGSLGRHWGFHSDLVYQRNLITRICTAFPNLKNISFMASLLWYKDRVLRDWRAFVPYKERASVLMSYHGDHTNSEMQDYNGCFASFISPAGTR